VGYFPEFPLLQSQCSGLNTSSYEEVKRVLNFLKQINSGDDCSKFATMFQSMFYLCEVLVSKLCLTFLLWPNLCMISQSIFSKETSPLAPKGEAAGENRVTFRSETWSENSYLLMLRPQAQTSVKTVKTLMGRGRGWRFLRICLFSWCVCCQQPQETRIWNGGLVHDFQEARQLWQLVIIVLFGPKMAWS